MNPLPFFAGAPGRVAAILLVVWGIALVWTSLTGGSDPAHALARRNVRMLHRMEAFRRFMTGLVLVGVGSAVLAQAPWLLWLAVGIGFVEILESSTLIAVWKLRPPAHPRPRPTSVARLSEYPNIPDPWVSDSLAPMAALVRSYPQTGRCARK